MLAEPNRCLDSADVFEALRSRVYDDEVLVTALMFGDAEQQTLFEMAREAREAAFPERKVEVRSVMEISNICKQDCSYCNMGKSNPKQFYNISFEQLFDLTEHLYDRGRRVFLLQSGENPAQQFVDHVSKCVEKVKSTYADVTIILCLGNLSSAQYKQLKAAGADRYIIKFETSNERLYSRIKATDTLKKRIRCLEMAIDAGLGCGTGNIVGLPGQTLADIAADLKLTAKYKLDMNSATVFVPAEKTRLRNEPMGDLDLTLNTMALMRIMSPHRLMPTTSSLERGRKGGQLMGLMAGANTVTIHDGTPENFKALFPIYSMNRITPNLEHMRQIVEKAGLRMEVANAQ